MYYFIERIWQVYGSNMVEHYYVLAAYYNQHACVLAYAVVVYSIKLYQESARRNEGKERKEKERKTPCVWWRLLWSP